MSDLVVTNWFGDLISRPKVIVEAHSVEDIVRVLTDPVRYPSPVRAVGSNHSTARCGVADGGTLLKMAGMNRILDIGTDTVTAQAGALYIDVAEELRNRNLQFHVCTEIGNLSIGSAACAGTKDGSMPGEYGQVGSYVTAVKMVLPNGRLLEASDETDPELMQQIRASYGTFGVIYEATLKVRPLTAVQVYHRTFALQEFLEALPELRASGVSMMYYMFPFVDKITVEFRRYNPTATARHNQHAWTARNRGWAVIGPVVGRWAAALPGAVRHPVLNALTSIWRYNLVHRVKSDDSLPTEQTIRYPPVGGACRYTFSLFAFRVEEFPKVVQEFYRFCKEYYQRTGYRTNLSYVGYRISGDQRSLLSYSFDGEVMTLDPVSTNNPGWKEFLREFNEFCSVRKGVPLFNQTFGVTREIARQAFGERLDVISRTRQTYDPDGRLLNDYFRELLAPAGVHQAASLEKSGISARSQP
jgi:hypothetical protein